MAFIVEQQAAVDPLIRLESDELAVIVTPGKGGDVVAIRHRPTDRAVLWRTPWGGRPAARVVPGGDDVASWLEQCRGGWQIMVPNAGARSVHRGVQHSFHGEASVAPWEWSQVDDALHLVHAFFTLPLTMTRRLQVAHDLLVIDEAIQNTGSERVELIWGHHPGFGGDLLAGPARLTCGARRVLVDDQPDERGNALRPGSVSAWPEARGSDGGVVDLRDPLDGRHGMAYLLDFDTGWAGLTRRDGAIGVALSWDVALFPVAWLWQELNGSRTPPWFGRARVIGIEPCTSWPGRGLAATVTNGGAHLVLAPGETRRTAVRLHVFTGLAEVTGIEDGRARGTEYAG